MSRSSWASNRDNRSIVNDDRGVTPVVGKAMEVAIVVLYVGVVTTSMYTGVVPEYRDTTGDRIGERTLATAGDRVEAAVPPTTPVTVERRVRVDLPETIRGTGYWIHADGEVLVLDHPRDAIDGEIRLTLPSRVSSVSGSWSSYEPATVVVEGTSDELRVRLVRQ